MGFVGQESSIRGTMIIIEALQDYFVYLCDFWEWLRERNPLVCFLSAPTLSDSSFQLCSPSRRSLREH